MNFIQYGMTHAGLLMLYLIVLWPLIKLTDRLEQQEGLRLVLIAARVLWVLWVVISFWMSHQTTKKMVFENMPLKKATIASFYDARLYLAFLPIVGKYVEPREKDKDTSDRRDI